MLLSPRSLKIFQVSQTIARGGPRSQIAIPAQGMIEFRDALTDLLEEFGTDDGGNECTCFTLFTSKALNYLLLYTGKACS